MFFIYGVSVQILITAALLLGGSAALSVMTGASVIAMNYLIPFGVVLYTYLGGLKSTFLSDYIQYLPRPLVNDSELTSFLALWSYSLSF